MKKNFFNGVNNHYKYPIRNINASNSENHKTGRYRNSRQEGRRKRDKMMVEKRAVYVLKRGGDGWNELYREFVYFVLLEMNISNDIGFP